MRKRGQDYQDLGEDHFIKENAEAAARHYTRRLQQLGYDLQLTSQAVPVAA
jgi:hypothetical protein